jgi:dsRNA-specific ribonuclease
MGCYGAWCVDLAQDVSKLTSFAVDGEWKGQGNASSKQIAKEEAAKAAFNSLHWG